MILLTLSGFEVLEMDCGGQLADYTSLREMSSLHNPTEEYSNEQQANSYKEKNRYVLLHHLIILLISLDQPQIYGVAQTSVNELYQLWGYMYICIYSCS